MSRSVWGLSNYMIAKQEAGAVAVREKATEWIKFIAPMGIAVRLATRLGVARGRLARTAAAG